MKSAAEKPSSILQQATGTSEASHRLDPAPFVDNRPETAVQRQLSEIIQRSPRTAAQRKLTEMANQSAATQRRIALATTITNSPLMVAQRKRLQSLFEATSHAGLEDGEFLGRNFDRVQDKGIEKEPPLEKPLPSSMHGPGPGEAPPLQGQLEPTQRQRLRNAGPLPGKPAAIPPLISTPRSTTQHTIAAHRPQTNSLPTQFSANKVVQRTQDDVGQLI